MGKILSGRIAFASGDYYTIVYFSRGKGRGHAVPDNAIARRLLQRSPSIDIRFVSYSTGADVLRQCGWSVTELNLSEEPNFSDSLYEVARLLHSLPATLVVCHEEFAALCVAKALGIRTVFLTDWFISPESVIMQSLKYVNFPIS
jgi:UDP:flavonoid glycosyltransferase YjiC (YdhE family)